MDRGDAGWATVTVDETRLWRRHLQLAEIGGTPAGGVNREAMTEGDREAHVLLMQWGAEIGLQAAVDPIGNLFLRREGSRSDAALILTGSHLDTQPTGGKFDGALHVPYKTLPSGATHDAKWLSRVAPSGMIFVPCEGGISHNER